jgi:diguanylate cyclase (GGDEF)-like protein
MKAIDPALLRARSDMARLVAQALGVPDAGLAGALLEMVDRSGLFLAVKNASSGHYVHVNPSMAELFDHTPESMVNQLDSGLMAPDVAASIRAAEQAALTHAEPTISAHRLGGQAGGQGGKREFTVTRIPLPRADGGAVYHLLSVWSEQTEAHRREHQLKQALQQLEQQQVAIAALRQEIKDQAQREGATGLYQQANFDDHLRREIDLSSREHRQFALVLISLDTPSGVVQTLGYEAHERVLESLGRLLRSNTRAMDAACRLDENRFAVLLSGVGLATAHTRMEGMRRQCATQIVMLNGRDLGFSVSMGVASFPHTARSETELLQAAKLALDEACSRGGNQVALASIRFESAAN